jgi:hypothetical protein
MIDTNVPLNALSSDLQINWMAQLHHTEPTEKGVFKLVFAERTGGRSYLGQRVSVLVVNEHNIPMPLVPVAFSYSTAEPYLLTEDFKWTPPSPQKAFIEKTLGGGMVDMVQGSPVKKGEPGGMTVYVLEPEYSSEVVTGCGMLSNHDGMFLVFKLFK